MDCSATCLVTCLLLTLDLLDVELQLLTLKDISISAAGLARTRGNYGVQATGSELIVQERIDLGPSGTAGLLAGHMIGDLFNARSFSGGSLTLGRDQLTLTEDLAIVALPPLTEGCSINLHNGTLDESLGTYQLIIAGIIDDVN